MVNPFAEQAAEGIIKVLGQTEQKRTSPFNMSMTMKDPKFWIGLMLMALGKGGREASRFITQMYLAGLEEQLKREREQRAYEREKELLKERTKAQKELQEREYQLRKEIEELRNEYRKQLAKLENDLALGRIKEQEETRRKLLELEQQIKEKKQQLLRDAFTKLYTGIQKGEVDPEALATITAYGGAGLAGKIIGQMQKDQKISSVDKAALQFAVNAAKGKVFASDEEYYQFIANSFNTFKRLLGGEVTEAEKKKEQLQPSEGESRVDKVFNMLMGTEIPRTKIGGKELIDMLKRSGEEVMILPSYTPQSDMSTTPIITNPFSTEELIKNIFGR